VLQQLSRDEEAAAFLRRELDSTLVRGDARHAAGLLVSFYSAALTLERFGELQILCDRVLRLSPDAKARRLLLTARISTLAFAGNIDEYDRLASGADLRWADHRAASFLAALRGDVDGAMRSYVSYHGELKPEHARQNPSDVVLQATNAMFQTGMTALETIEGTPSTVFPVRAHPAAAGLRLLRRIAYGQWPAASAMIGELPFWDASYDEPYGILDLRLLYSALARERPRAEERTIGSLRRMIARRQVRHAVSPARWYMLAMSSSGAEAAPEIAAFVADSLEVVPMPYLFGGLPLSIAMLATSFGGARCAAALESWPTYGSRWHRAHLILARGLLTEENSVLRQARAAFDELGAPVFAMLAGIALPVPRARDVALAATLGQRPRMPQRLTPRETDVAELAATGARNRDIAEKLNISERTVEVHLTSAFRKLGVRSRGGLAQRLINREGSSAS
jgi:DNA-binding CsgD family transcriptional regulator